MIDVLILFLIFYFLLYKRALKKFGDNPKKSVWIRWLRRREGSWLDSLVMKNREKQVPLLKCILLAGAIRMLFFFPVAFGLQSFLEENLDPNYKKEIDYHVASHLIMSCNLCAPVGIPVLMYLNDQRKKNPEEMFLYKYKKVKGNCVASGFKHDDCSVLFRMIESTDSAEIFSKLTIVLLESTDSKYDFCSFAGRASSYFFDRSLWDEFVEFGEIACLNKKVRKCSSYCDSFKSRQEWGRERMIEHTEWVKSLRKSEGREMSDYDWDDYPIPRDHDFSIKELDEYIEE